MLVFWREEHLSSLNSDTRYVGKIMPGPQSSAMRGWVKFRGWQIFAKT